MSRMLSVTREAQAQQQQRKILLQFCIGIFWSKGQRIVKAEALMTLKLYAECIGAIMILYGYCYAARQPRLLLCIICIQNYADIHT